MATSPQTRFTARLLCVEFTPGMFGTWLAPRMPMSTRSCRM